MKRSVEYNGLRHVAKGGPRGALPPQSNNFAPRCPPKNVYTEKYSSRKKAMVDLKFEDFFRVGSSKPRKLRFD